MEVIKAYFRKLIGLIYLLNKNTGETHLVSAITYQCGANKIKESNKQYLSQKGFDKIKFKYANHKFINGCVHCNKANNKG